MKKWIILTAIANVILLTGCATEGPGNDAIRRVFPGETVVPREANRIALSLPVDRTGIPILGEKLHRRMASLFGSRGRLAVVSPGEEADLKLDTEILSFRIQPVSFDSLGQIVKKRVRLSASIAIYNLHTGAVILRDAEIQSFREYSDLVPPIESDEMATDAALDSLAERIVTKVETGWYTPLLTPQERR